MDVIVFIVEIKRRRRKGADTWVIKERVTELRDKIYQIELDKISPNSHDIIWTPSFLKNL